MKKIFILATAIMLAAGTAFAQQEESLETQMALDPLEAANSYADTKDRKSVV